MTGYRYPQGAILGDYARAGAGLIVSVGLLLFTDLLPIVTYIAWGLTVLFVIFAWRTLLRQYSRIEADERGIRLHNQLFRGFDRDLPWPGLQDLKVRFFSTKRDRSDGWMQIVLKGNKGQIRLDSTLEGFEGIAELAVEAARRQQLVLSPTTLTNLQSMGLAPKEGA